MNRISEDVSRVRMFLGPAILYSTNPINRYCSYHTKNGKYKPKLTLYALSPLPILVIAIYKVSSVMNIRVKLCKGNFQNFLV